jgi:hypothetical protein
MKDFDRSSIESGLITMLENLSETLKNDNDIHAIKREYYNDHAKTISEWEHDVENVWLIWMQSNILLISY